MGSGFGFSAYGVQEVIAAINVITIITMIIHITTVALFLCVCVFQSSEAVWDFDEALSKSRPQAQPTSTGCRV